MSEAGRGRAIVIGASIGGLLAARALADAFAEVVVLDRDVLDDAAEYRRGVPQGRHTHVVLVSGCRALEALLPGICAELSAAGAIGGDVGTDVSWFIEGARLCRVAGGLEGLGMSRALLERTVRSRVRALPNVCVRDTANVDGLTVTNGNQHVTGVALGAQTLDAALVVDATGRGSRTPGWLATLGYEEPRSETVGIELRYTTRRFRRRPGQLGGLNAVVVPPTPKNKRGGVIVAQEDDCWTVTLMTHFADYPAPELDAFIEFTRTLPIPDIYDVVRNAEPVGDAQTIRMPASMRRRYEQLKAFPAGYLVFGDALSSFNPIYGQGMSVAALEAVALQAVLRHGTPDFTHRFFREAANIIDTAWSISAGNDLRMPEATGRRSAVVRLTNWYVPKLLRASHHDPELARAFLNVSNLMADPLSLMRPNVLAAVARAALRRPMSRTVRDTSAGG